MVFAAGKNLHQLNKILLKLLYWSGLPLKMSSISGIALTRSITRPVLFKLLREIEPTNTLRFPVRGFNYRIKWWRQ